MKNFFLKVNIIIKASLPYTALLAVVLGAVNIVFICKVKSDIEYTYDKVCEVESTVHNINNDYDNSDVIDMIRNHHNKVMQEIEDAAFDIERAIRIWSD